MERRMFLKWLVEHCTEQLKHAIIIVSHTFLYLILLLMLFIGSLLKGAIDPKSAEPPIQRPIIVIVKHNNAPQRKLTKKRRGGNQRPRIKKHRTDR